MTARDVIARVVQDFVDPQKGDWVSDAYRSAADDIVVALHAAGYRLIGPGELDPKTIERCIAANDKARERVIHSGQSVVINGIRAGHDRAESALRALQSQEAGNEG